MKISHTIDSVKFFDDSIFIFKLTEISSLLSKALKSELENYIVSPAGYGISWPSLDKDLSIDGRPGRKHKPDFQKRRIISKKYINHN